MAYVNDDLSTEIFVFCPEEEKSSTCFNKVHINI